MYNNKTVYVFNENNNSWNNKYWKHRYLRWFPSIVIITNDFAIFFLYISNK